MIATPTWEPEHAATASCAAWSARSTASARAGGGRDGHGGRRAGPLGSGRPSNGRPKSPGNAALFSFVSSAVTAEIAKTSAAKHQRRDSFMTSFPMLHADYEGIPKSRLGLSTRIFR